MPIKLSDLDLALDCTSTDFLSGDYFAYINRETGELIHDDEGMDGAGDDVPDDIDDIDKYIQVPTKQDLGLGKPLVIQFSSEVIPDELNTVHAIFSKKGAYQRYKQLLSQLGKLDDWHNYEAEQQKKALLEWCDENDLEVVV